jgi:hypothetical protein
MTEIDRDRPWLSRLAQRGQKTKVIAVGLPEGPSSTTVFLGVQKQFRKANGDPWYYPDRPEPGSIRQRSKKSSKKRQAQKAQAQKGQPQKALKQLPKQKQHSSQARPQAKAVPARSPKLAESPALAQSLLEAWQVHQQHSKPKENP